MNKENSANAGEGTKFRWTNIIQMSLVLWLTYLLVTGNFEMSNLAVGLLIAIIISLLTRPQQLAIRWHNLPLALWATTRYLFHLFWELIVSSIQVSKIVLDPKLPIDPGIVEIDAGCQSELSAALSAHALTLTPGELVVEMDADGRLYAHCLDEKKSAQVAVETQNLRRELLSKIFD